jgi:adenylate cyclase
MTETSVGAARAEGAIVFTDIAGFTEYTAMRGDDAALELLGVQEELVVSRLGSRCRIVKELGDGLLLWFNDACDAIEGALSLLEGFDHHCQQNDLPLFLRAGLHFGHPAQRGSDLIGHDVNVAARIVDLSGPGEVLVSEALRDRASDGIPCVRFEEVGPTVMRGIPEPVNLYRVVRSES